MESGKVDSAAPESGHAEQQPDPLAVLWVPDPAERRGWREFYVYPKKANAVKPGMGFKK